MAYASGEKWVFIVNPIAGNSFGIKMVPEIENKIREHNIDGQVVLTEYHGHASELARSFAEKGIKYIIAVGGDGTFNEVAKVLINNRSVVTGIVPAGSGNDFVQIPGFPNRFTDKEWGIFFNKNTISQDVGFVNDIPFFNGLGIGFDAEVAAQNYTEDGKVRRGGSDKYIWHIVKTLLFFREKKMIVVTEGQKHETDCFMNTVSIGRRFAGSFFLTPQALANDGLLDVCSIKKLNLFQRFRLLLKVPSGSHISDKLVNYFKTPAINLEFPDKVPFHVDGEIYFSKSFEIKILPGSLNIIYNPDGDHFFKRN